MSLAPHHNKLNANNLEELAELHPAAGLFREEGHYLTGIQFVARTANNKPLFKHPIRSEHSHTAAYSGSFSYFAVIKNLHLIEFALKQWQRVK